MNELINDIGWISLIVLLITAFVTSMIHGATGIAGGFLLTVVAAPILGLQAVIPVLSVTLLVSHGSRALFNLKNFDKAAYLKITIPAFPCTVLAALIYGKLEGSVIAFVLGTVVLASVPLRRWANAKKIVTSDTGMIASGAVYGGIAGLSIGPGLLLMPVLLGYGLGRQAFVATLAAIALTTNIVRSIVYGTTSLLSEPYVILALMTGLATIPGAWIGKRILQRLTDKRHIIAVEWLVLLGGLSFYWMGYQALRAA